MKSIEELQADLKQIYSELEERKQMEQVAAVKDINFNEISSKAERYSIVGHPMCDRDEHEQAMYLLLLLSVISMDDVSYDKSFSLLYRISHGMKFNGNVQDLFIQAKQINFDRIDEITRLFINDDVKYVMLMECMMLAQCFKKEYKKAMEYIAELCILLKLDKEQITMISNIARVVLMQSVYEYKCDIKNTIESFNCYLYMLEKANNLKATIYTMPSINTSSTQSNKRKGMFGMFSIWDNNYFISFDKCLSNSYHYISKNGWLELVNMNASYVTVTNPVLFKIDVDQKVMYFRNEM